MTFQAVYSCPMSTKPVVLLLLLGLCLLIADLLLLFVLIGLVSLQLLIGKYSVLTLALCALQWLTVIASIFCSPFRSRSLVATMFFSGVLHRHICHVKVEATRVPDSLRTAIAMLRSLGLQLLNSMNTQQYGLVNCNGSNHFTPKDLRSPRAQIIAAPLLSR